MSTEIIVAIITTSGVVLAAIIPGIFSVSRRRNDTSKDKRANQNAIVEGSGNEITQDITNNKCGSQNAEVRGKNHKINQKH